MTPRPAGHQHRLTTTAKGEELHGRLLDFMNDVVLPAEPEYRRQRATQPSSHVVPPVVEDLKAEARRRGLWNLFLPAESGISQLDYAVLAELTGWSLHLAPEAINGQAPDTGNMELLHMFGTDEQKQRWLEPLLDGSIRSAFAMTEIAVASSDATNIETTIERDGPELVVNGRKWWTSGIADPRCRVVIVMEKTDPGAPPHRQQSMVLVPVETPGLSVVRDVPVFGHHDQHGHCEVLLDDVRVPAGHLLGEEGGGFAMAQARLGPGRIHHCMRALARPNARSSTSSHGRRAVSPSAARCWSGTVCRPTSRSRGSPSTRLACCVTRQRASSTRRATRPPPSWCRW